MMKYFWILIMLFCSVFMLSSDEIRLKLIHDAPVWEAGVFNLDDNSITKFLPQGTIVTGDTPVRVSCIYKSRTQEATQINHIGKEYTIPAFAIIPEKTESLFSENFITDISDSDRKVWLQTYFLDVLISQDRNAVYNYAPKAIQYFSDWKKEDEYASDWFDMGLTEESLTILQTQISLAGIYSYSFWVKNIKEISNGYKVSVYGRIPEKTVSQYDDFGFPNINNNVSNFDLFFIFDGDYLDIYMSSMDNHLSTVALVSQELYEKVSGLIIANSTVDLTSITWPTRADGSMDYPVPSGILLQNFIPTHNTTEETPLLSEDSPDSEASTLPANTPLRWIGKGTEGRIKVLTPSGQEGWCPVDKLENIVDHPESYEAIPAPDIPKPIQEEETALSLDKPQPEANHRTTDQRPAVYHDDDESLYSIVSQLYWFPYAVAALIAIVLIVLSICTILLVRKKKKR